MSALIFLSKFSYMTNSGLRWLLGLGLWLMFELFRELVGNVDGFEVGSCEPKSQPDLSGVSGSVIIELELLFGRPEVGGLNAHPIRGLQKLGEHIHNLLHLLAVLVVVVVVSVAIIIFTHFAHLYVGVVDGYKVLDGCHIPQPNHIVEFGRAQLVVLFGRDTDIGWFEIQLGGPVHIENKLVNGLNDLFHVCGVCVLA